MRQIRFDKGEIVIKVEIVLYAIMNCEIHRIGTFFVTFRCQMFPT